MKTFTCIENQCAGITPRTCISRQIATRKDAEKIGKRHSHGVFDVYTGDYPECLDCAQGQEVLAEHPELEKEIESKPNLKKKGQTIMTVRDYEYTRPYVPRYLCE